MGRNFGAGFKNNRYVSRCKLQREYQRASEDRTEEGCSTFQETTEEELEFDQFPNDDLNSPFHHESENRNSTFDVDFEDFGKGVRQDGSTSAFGKREAVDIVAALLLYNSVSRAFADDIFSISKLIRQYGITTSEVFTRMDNWSNHDNRTYSFCSSCENLMSEASRCRNNECVRYGKSQANLAGTRKLLTFSIRKQLEGILKTGNFDEEILNRNTRKSSLSKRLSATPKYLQRLKKAEEDYPEMLTLFLSINIDGFRKRGLSRGEFWPFYVAANDLNNGNSEFFEYRPEVVMLSSLVQCSKMKKEDFIGAFERLRLEVLDSQTNPLEIELCGNVHRIRLEIYQTVIDMDASKKIHGLPCWLSYNSCSRCDIAGKRIPTKKGTKIAWIPEGVTTQYSSTNIPEKLNLTSLPPPWTEGFDSLHLIYEGTSRDVLKDIFGTCRKYKMRMERNIRIRWAEALDRAQTPKKQASTTLLDPITLSNRTGHEVQQIFNVAVPALIVIHESCELWLFCMYLQWIFTRLVVDPLFCISHISTIEKVTPVLKAVLANNYPGFYTMKQHFVLDHMVERLRDDGSPLLSSASPFERLNQVLGRGTDANSTRTVLNMSRRFMGLQRAVAYCSASIKKHDCPVSYPKTMKAVKEETYVTSPKIDDEPLTRGERDYLDSMNFSIPSFRCSACHNSKVYSTRRACSASIQKNCFIYYAENQKNVKFASIERFFHHGGLDMVLIKTFQTVSAFLSLSRWCSTNGSFASIIEVAEASNIFFQQVIGFDFHVIQLKQVLGMCTVIEVNSKSFVSRS